MLYIACVNGDIPSPMFFLLFSRKRKRYINDGLIIIIIIIFSINARPIRYFQGVKKIYRSRYINYIVARLMVDEAYAIPHETLFSLSGGKIVLLEQRKEKYIQQPSYIFGDGGVKL